MSGSDSKAAEPSSRGREVADPEPPQPQRSSWVALMSSPLVFDRKGKGARPKGIRRGEHIRLDLHDPPLISYLEVMFPRARTAAVSRVGYFAQKEEQESAGIIAADRSGRLLLQLTDPVSTSAPELFIGDSHARTISRIPEITFTARSSNSRIAFLPNPLISGEYVVAQFHPRTSSTLVADTDDLLLYSTASQQWSLKALHLHASFTDCMRNLCADSMVIAHDKRLWWLALAYGLFVCDPFTARPSLRFIALPAGCEMREELFHRDQRRLVAPSEGELRYVEMRLRGVSNDVDAHGEDAAPLAANPSVSMWTLVDLQPGAAEPWRLEYDVPLSDIWDHPSYIAAGLPRLVPHLAVVDPTDHGLVYFFQGPNVFGLDMRGRMVVSCGDGGLARAVGLGEEQLQTSPPVLIAWQLFADSKQEESCQMRRASPRHIVDWDMSPPPASHGGVASKDSGIDWDEVQNPHLEAERVGFHGNTAYLDTRNPLRSIRPTPNPPPLPVPQPETAADASKKNLQDSIESVDRAILQKEDKKRRDKHIRELRYLRKLLQTMDEEKKPSV